MATLKPGNRVRGSDTGRPIMVILDLLGRRWALRIGWELRDGPLHYRELQRRCGIASPNILSTRLKESRDAGLLQKNDAGEYQLTPRGESLSKLLEPLDQWAKEWAEEVTRD